MTRHHQVVDDGPQDTGTGDETTSPPPGRTLANPVRAIIREAKETPSPLLSKVEKLG